MASLIDSFKQIFESKILQNPSGAFEYSKYANTKLDLHSYIADGIRSLPVKYQPGEEWYKWIPGKSPLSTSECREQRRAATSEARSASLLLLLLLSHTVYLPIACTCWPCTAPLLFLAAPQVALAVVLYLSTLFVGRQLMKGRKPYSACISILLSLSHSPPPPHLPSFMVCSIPTNCWFSNCSILIHSFRLLVATRFSIILIAFDTHSLYLNLYLYLHGMTLCRYGTTLYSHTRRCPPEFATLFQIHNLLLSSASGLLLTLMLIEVSVTLRITTHDAFAHTQSYLFNSHSIHASFSLFKSSEIHARTFLWMINRSHLSSSRMDSFTLSVIKDLGLQD